MCWIFRFEEGHDLYYETHVDFKVFYAILKLKNNVNVDVLLNIYYVMGYLSNDPMALGGAVSVFCLYHFFCWYGNSNNKFLRLFQKYFKISMSKLSKVTQTFLITGSSFQVEKENNCTPSSV